MAEIVVSGAITLVTTVAPFLYQICSDGDRQNIDELKKWLDTMIATKYDAEGRGDQPSDQLWALRVQLVQNLALKTEDAIEEFLYDVQDHSHHHWITKFLHAAAHPKEVLALKQLSSSMAAIKKEVDDIGNLDNLRIAVASSSTTAGEVSETYNSFSRNDHHDLVGIQRRVGPLLDRVLRGDQPRDPLLEVISVIGDPGSGKSTVIHEVFKRVKDSFECYVWVSVPPSCKDLLEKLCQELELPFDPGRTKERSLQLHLQPKRFILVFDGIWSEDQWHRIEKLLPCNIKQGSKIIISTRNRNLASYCTRSHSHYTYDLNLDPLTSEEALELFSKKVFQGDKCPDHLVDYCEKIVRRCEKSPHAIVAVGDFLSQRSEELPLNGTDFHNVLVELEFVPGHPVSLSCYRIFSHSYYHLLPNLRSCFLYLLNFPEDHSVTRGRLIHQWIGCGFIEKKEGTTLEQVANEYLDVLVQMSMVQVTKRDSQGRIRSCRVSNLARGFILSVSEKENFINVLRSPKASLGGEKIRRLSLHNCFPSMLQSANLSYVRSFSMYEVENFSESKAKVLLKKFKLITSLEMENPALKHFPKKVFNLHLLRYLSLRSTRIDSVPRSIKKLQNLMVLDLRNTGITKLPKKTLKLPKLLHLFVGCPNADVGAQVYPGIKCSTLMQKLSLMEANYEGKSIVKELGNFIDLRKLGITGLKEIEGKDLCASLDKMEHLYSLSVSSASKEYLNLKDVKKPPQLLQKLSLVGRLKEIPAWVGELNNLYRIELKWSKLQNSPLEALHALPSLKELHLYGAYTGASLVFNAQSFLELTILEIEQCDQLIKVVILEQAMPKLQKLIIRNCQSLVMVRMTKKMVSQKKDMCDLPDCTIITEE